MGWGLIAAVVTVLACAGGLVVAAATVRASEGSAAARPSQSSDRRWRGK